MSYKFQVTSCKETEVGCSDNLRLAACSSLGRQYETVPERSRRAAYICNLPQQNQTWLSVSVASRVAPKHQTMLGLAFKRISAFVGAQMA